MAPRTGDSGTRDPARDRQDKDGFDRIAFDEEDVEEPGADRPSRRSGTEERRGTPGSGPAPRRSPMDDPEVQDLRRDAEGYR
ncbi:hypothetical protein [Streptomyces minutiscleroticus]|uniref:Uncharacterized protein n=1 Tax=Streptomyces minutiscleroticus TaxID=68238 RepID=A0A918NSX5_9ACTN|nr:hypothetical protein [Streptomyces minutiscleroticus]GGX93516.1 hypothetical protein GCM10010358_54150 [Streptomyces minutiscleroticus]